MTYFSSKTEEIEGTKRFFFKYHSQKARCHECPVELSIKFVREKKKLPTQIKFRGHVKGIERGWVPNGTYY